MKRWYKIYYAYLSYDVPRTGTWGIDAYSAKEAIDLFCKYHIKGSPIGYEIDGVCTYV